MKLDGAFDHISHRLELVQNLVVMNMMNLKKLVIDTRS